MESKSIFKKCGAKTTFKKGGAKVLLHFFKKWKKWKEKIDFNLLNMNKLKYK